MIYLIIYWNIELLNDLLKYRFIKWFIEIDLFNDLLTLIYWQHIDLLYNLLTLLICWHIDLLIELMTLYLFIDVLIILMKKLNSHYLLINFFYCSWVYIVIIIIMSLLSHDLSKNTSLNFVRLLISFSLHNALLNYIHKLFSVRKWSCENWLADHRTTTSCFQ